jgi:hypothetical protein
MTTFPISLKRGRTNALALCTSSFMALIPVFIGDKITYAPNDSPMPKFVQKKTVSIMVRAIPQSKAPGANQLLCILFWRFAEKLAGNARYG